MAQLTEQAVKDLVGNLLTTAPFTGVNPQETRSLAEMLRTLTAENEQLRQTLSERSTGLHC